MQFMQRIIKIIRILGVKGEARTEVRRGGRKGTPFISDKSAHILLTLEG